MGTRRFFIISIVAVFTSLFLAGCDGLASLRDSFRGQAEKTAQSVNDTVTKVTTQIKETKESIEEKVEEVNDAVREVREAVDAVQKISK